MLSATQEVGNLQRYWMMSETDCSSPFYARSTSMRDHRVLTYYYAVLDYIAIHYVLYMQDIQVRNANYNNECTIKYSKYSV